MLLLSTWQRFPPQRILHQSHGTDRSNILGCYKALQIASTTPTPDAHSRLLAASCYCMSAASSSNELQRQGWIVGYSPIHQAPCQRMLPDMRRRYSAARYSHVDDMLNKTLRTLLRTDHHFLSPIYSQPPGFRNHRPRRATTHLPIIGANACGEISNQVPRKGINNKYIPDTDTWERSKEPVNHHHSITK